MSVVVDFQEVRLRGLALDLARFLKHPTNDSLEAVEYAHEVLESLRDRGRNPATEHLALQHADLFLLLIEEGSEPGLDSGPSEEGSESDSQSGSRQFC